MNDLTFSSARIVDEKEHPEIPWTGPQPQPSKPVLEVEFKSNVDLFAYAKMHEYEVGVSVYLCADGSHDKDKELLGSPYVYGSGGRIDAYSPSYSAGSGSIYRIYIEIKSEGVGVLHELGKKPFNYDLLTSADDVCFFIRGGSMNGGHFESNLVRVPRSALRDALDRSKR
ncbi:hypothetical protein [Aliidongia dinghuensis]|uniref:hypothetical protein n=1 Tax=Aliidongia dinghuensis TaxID=1867774 RepID=UPI00166A8C86|nr:hypothetical protein [Aliidongia dinghuensis]